MQKFDQEFKQNAVKLALEKGNVKQIAQDLGVGKSTLDKWVSQYRSGLLKSGGISPEQEEIRRLRREVNILRQERDILKKAMSIFSSKQVGNSNL
jgi:transposase